MSLGKRSQSKWLAYFIAMRARQFDDWAKMQSADHPDAIVLHIGCGLDGTIWCADVQNKESYQRGWRNTDIWDRCSGEAYSGRAAV